jgi:hypothetical protein
MSIARIPDQVRDEALRVIQQFNQKKLSKTDCRYIPRFKGKFLYLYREDFGKLGPICRLEYIGGKKGWYFAIYKYSKDRYDPEECFFPGSQLVDGTIQGALEAGMEAYQ